MKQDLSGLSDTKSAHNTPPQKTFVSFSVTLMVKYKLHILFVVSAAIWPGEPRTVMVYACCSKLSLYSCEFCGQITQKPVYDLTPVFLSLLAIYHVYMPTTLPMSILFEHIRLILLSFLYLQNTSSPDFIMAFSFISSCLC